MFCFYYSEEVHFYLFIYLLTYLFIYLFIYLTAFLLTFFTYLFTLLLIFQDVVKVDDYNFLQNCT